MYVFLNPNPKNKIVGDCVIRAISILLSQDWITTYIGLAIQGYIDADLPSADSVWNNYLMHKGFKRHNVSDQCPDCINVREFAEQNPEGRYLLFVGGHVVTVIDGSYYDTWDSGDKTVFYYFQQKHKSRPV